MMWNRNEQTICAISTPHGVGGIAVIRVSGPQALSISGRICKRLSKSLSKNETLQSHRAYFSEIHDLKGQKIDEAVVTYFAQGKSFTGEEVIEISCHGSPYITGQILDQLTQAGAKIAEPGEFTYRAFMNNKLDLVQAESVLSLIESRNKSAAKVALRQLEGHVSKEVEELISDLTWCLAHIEASIDFIEQGIEVVDTSELIRKLEKINGTLEKLLQSYESGRLIKDGIKVALLGEPNVGKSSLLNLLLQNDKAIVTPIAGTTRDVIDGEVIFDGMKYVVSDTAGLRDTQDEVEIIGIDRSRQEAEKADLLCFVFDATEKDQQRSLQMAAEIQNNKKIFLLNKSDMVSADELYQIQDEIAMSLGLSGAQKILATSARDATSRSHVFAAIKSAVGQFDYLDEAVISSSRQFEQAQYSFEMISKSVDELKNKTGAEFVALYLKEALLSLQKILGQVYDDQIMDRVFKEFCLGK